MRNWKSYALLLTTTVLIASVLVPKAKSIYSSPVTVQNPFTSPVPTLNVNEPGDQPFRQSLCTAFSSAGNFDPCGGVTFNFVVPNSSNGATVKRLVVENVAGNCNVEFGSLPVTPPGVSLNSSGAAEGPSENDFNLGQNNSTGAANANLHVFGQTTRIYYEPGETVALSLLFNQLQIDANSAYVCHAQLEGFYVTQ